MEQGDHEEAFRFFQAIACDAAQDSRSRADAYVWMGTLVRIAPSLGDEDECGLSFYQRALELDPENLGAMVGIVETFGGHVPDHQDDSSFRRAMAWLLRHRDSLNEDVRGEIDRIRSKHARVLSGSPSP